LTAIKKPLASFELKETGKYRLFEASVIDLNIFKLKIDTFMLNGEDYLWLEKKRKNVCLKGQGIFWKPLNIK
jgi:hypothetical protein